MFFLVSFLLPFFGGLYVFLWGFIPDFIFILVHSWVFALSLCFNHLLSYLSSPLFLCLLFPYFSSYENQSGIQKNYKFHSEKDGCIVCPTTDSTFDIWTEAIKEWNPKNPVLRALIPPLRTLNVYPRKNRWGKHSKFSYDIG